VIFSAHHTPHAAAPALLAVVLPPYPPVTPLPPHSSTTPPTAPHCYALNPAAAA
jgi:hypothetical protein